ncbi:tetratricopeptide repeat protein [Roseofilum sp. BLCC_M154]|uniref:Tetratricopeptide repeat protein n=1 Tax=Roseofilum acuticapitatum BLCC-M154 TaxID=3022444 RepID=A0ABT7AUR1_9CYAN|nr:tetratricopeptide repeat protein [Roseofilum acuticapitatum]MDJ1170643.1 tetratricopeptide repeat protein [Roseofilum acuticapitatum BLCC-M154]
MIEQQLYQDGIKKASQKDYEGAIAAFTEVITLNPDWSDPYYQRGLAYFDLGQIYPAISDYSQALERDRYHSQAYYARALARISLKNLPGTLEDINWVIQLKPEFAAAYQLRGTVERKQGNLQSAIANFKQAARLYLDQKDKENASRCLALIQQLKPKQPTPQATTPSLPLITESDFYQNLIDKAKQGKPQEAQEELNWILKTDQNDARAYGCRGIIYCQQGSYQSAISDFNRALALNFKDPIIYRNRGKARAQIGDHLGAIEDFNQALNNESNDPLIYIARGDAYRLTSHYAQAIQDYTTALNLDPNNGTAYYSRGLVHACLEEMKEAITDYQRAASKFCEQEKWSDYNQAISQLKKLQKAVPQSNTIQLESLLRQRLLRLVGGHWEIAQRLIDQAKQDYPGMAQEWYLEKVITDLEQR